MPNERGCTCPSYKQLSKSCATQSLWPHVARGSQSPFFESVTIDRDIDVALVAKLSGISETDFRKLNPASDNR